MANYLQKSQINFDFINKLLLTGQEQHTEQDGDIGCCGYILMAFSYILVALFFPLSLCLTIKVKLFVGVFFTKLMYRDFKIIAVGFCILI